MWLCSGQDSLGSGLSLFCFTELLRGGEGGDDPYSPLCPHLSGRSYLNLGPCRDHVTGYDMVQ